MSVRAALPRCPFVRLLALPYLRPPFLPPLRELDLLRFFPRPPPPFLRPPLSTYSRSPMLGVPLLCCLLRVSYSLSQSSMPFVFTSMCIFSCFLVPWIASGLSFRI